LCATITPGVPRRPEQAKFREPLHFYEVQRIRAWRGRAEAVLTYQWRGIVARTYGGAPSVRLEAELLVGLGTTSVHLHQLVTVRVRCDAFPNTCLAVFLRGMFSPQMGQDFVYELLLIRSFQAATTATKQRPLHLSFLPDPYA
jgi:hypothetical protein